VTVLVYDSGALMAAERDTSRFWLIHERALQRGVVPIVPSVVVVESTYPGMRNLDRLLAGCEVEPLELGPATAAANLRHVTPGGTVVDAVVVETSLRLGAAVVTSDRGDVEALATALNRTIAVIDI